ncbi:hypothetical protein [Arenimonas caeni]|uniref:Gluconate 2-dehydrogenase subunit 3 family protein n=1 Tax=Arenimonas caeni TaxID=2058085 RepID=A0A2P6M9W1_9GAMM|nr:hypothetical protein [Arenimonas caeni]PRH82769.1 hypothetical protein C6N40_06055 [Arenimonas caeni]
MNKPSAVAIPAALLAIFLHADEAAQGTPGITDYRTEGNLESTTELACIPLVEAKNTHTPADLYRAVADCVETGNFADGVLLFALAGVYGRFDTLRVLDKTAHQALPALQMENLWPIAEEKYDQFRTEAGRMLQDEKAFAAVCAEIRKLGPPNYYPRYMVQHGIGAFLSGPGSGDGLVPGFDEASGWDESLDNYLHCPQAPGAGG